MVTSPPVIIPQVGNLSDIFPNISNVANYSSVNGSGATHPLEDVHKPLTAHVGPEAAKEFPLALVVASPVVAISILIFFCIAYYWHSAQLDKRAQMLAIQQAADMECGLAPRSPDRDLYPVVEESPGNGHAGGGGGGIGAGRKHRTRRISSPTNAPGKRGSTVTDKDILTHYAARRHSTFFI